MVSELKSLTTKFSDIKLKRIRFEDVEKNQIEFNSKLSSTRIGRNKSDEQLSAIDNITKFYNSREEVIKIYNDFFKMLHKAAYNAKHRKVLKIITRKQMFQRITIALVQVKAGNTSDNLLNEIRQII